jgi:hypothetical protein
VQVFARVASCHAYRGRERRQREHAPARTAEQWAKALHEGSFSELDRLHCKRPPRLRLKAAIRIGVITRGQFRASQEGALSALPADFAPVSAETRPQKAKTGSCGWTPLFGIALGVAILLTALSSAAIGLSLLRFRHERRSLIPVMAG